MSHAGLGRASVLAVLVAIGLLCRAGAATAQDAFKPVVLTEKSMAAYVAALPEVAAVRRAMPNATQTFNADYWTKLAAIAKKHGFANYEDFVAVSATVVVVLTGIDPATKTFTEPKVVLEDQITFMTKFIDEVKADYASMPPTSKPAKAPPEILLFTQALDTLKEGRKTLPATMDPKNVALVKKYFDKMVLIANRR